MVKKLLLSLAVGLAATLTAPLGAFATVVNGDANLHPIDGSGIMGRLEFVDDRTNHVVTVSGTATGLEPHQAYFSLWYDIKSVPSGPHACEPSAEFRTKTASITEIQMIIGFWHNNNDGTGTLHARKTLTGNDNFTAANLAFNLAGVSNPLHDAFIAATAPLAFVPGSYAPLSDVHTISIRHATGLPPSDATFILQACGEIHSSA